MNMRWRAVNKIREFLNIDGDYKIYSPYYYIYSPWDCADFQSLYAKINNKTLVTADRCYMIHELATSCNSIDGEYVECGTWRGGSAYIIADAIKESNKSLHLFDTFEGMPITARSDPSKHKPGEMGDTSEKEVRQFLSNYSFITIHRGFIPDTLQAIRDKKFAFVYIDLDLYQSVKDAVAFFYSRTNRGGMILLDDYGFLGYQESARKAIDEFFDDKTESVIALPSGQALIIKK